jgi:hypothetical protein
MRMAGVIGVLLLVPATAHASPRRQGAMFGVAAGAGAFDADCELCGTGAAARGILRLGYLAGEHARVGAFAELTLSESWHEGGTLVHATIGLGVGTWIGERLSLSFSLGATAADDADASEGSDTGFSTGGIAFHGTAGYDVHHWRRRALVVRAGLGGGDFDHGWGTQVLLAVGVDGFEMGP